MTKMLIEQLLLTVRRDRQTNEKESDHRHDEISLASSFHGLLYM